MGKKKEERHVELKRVDGGFRGANKGGLKKDSAGGYRGEIRRRGNVCVWGGETVKGTRNVMGGLEKGNGRVN